MCWQHDLINYLQALVSYGEVFRYFTIMWGQWGIWMSIMLVLYTVLIFVLNNWYKKQKTPIYVCFLLFKGEIMGYFILNKYFVINF